MVYGQAVDDTEIEHKLTKAQAAMEAARAARVERQEAVLLAREAGWSKYRIAAVLGVRGPTVDSILKSAESDPAAATKET